MSRRDWGLLAAAVGLALLVRVLFLRQVAGHPLYGALTGDPVLYARQAADILAGRPVPEHAYFHSSPLYPFFLALLARLFGQGLGTVRLAQSLVGTGSVVLLFFLTRRTLGRRAAVVAALLAALYTPLVFFEGEILEITLVIALVTSMLLVIARADGAPRPAVAASAGALLGLASLGKPNLLLFAPAGALFIFLRTAGRLRSRALPAAAFFVAAGLAILPVTLHNLRVSGDLIPVSSNGGINLYIGNHPGAPGVFAVPTEMRLDLMTASAEAAERAVGRRLSAGEVSDYWAGKAFAYMRAAPGPWLRLMARKLALFWNHYEIPNHYHFYFVRGFAPVLRIPLSTFGVVAPLGLVGLGIAVARRRRSVWILVAFGLTFMASVVPFFITARYRLAIVPVLLAGAGYAIVEVCDLAKARRWRQLVPIAAVLAVLAVAVNVHMIEFGFAPMHNSLGAILGSRGDFEGAAREFGMALAEDPANVSAHYNLGLALTRLGRHADAAREFERAIELYPGYEEARVALRDAREALGRAATTGSGSGGLNGP